MNLSFLIAKKISVLEKKSFSLFITRIAITAIALSVSVMIIGTAITQGYQKHISQKFYNCWGHLHITTFLPDPSNIISNDKIIYDSIFHQSIQKTPHVKDVIPYTLQSAILKTKEGIEGIVLKGTTHSNSNSFQSYIIKGKNIDLSKDTFKNEILISSTLSNELNIQINNSIIVYFFSSLESQPRARKMNVVGIFNTGLEEFDKQFALCDSRFINQLNKDTGVVIQGYELQIDDIKNSELVEKTIFNTILEPPLEIYSLKKRFANVFSWLEMMQMNEKIIVIIMMLIAIINMISAILILILERTPMIGILKSLGMSNYKIQSIFLFNSLYIISIGIFIGTALGVGLCLLQQKIGFLKLDESTYYINKVPISLLPENVLFILLITVFSCMSILIIPSFLVRKISPTKAINFK